MDSYNLNKTDSLMRKRFNQYFEELGEYKCEELANFICSLNLPTPVTKQSGVVFLFVTKGEVKIGAGSDKLTAVTGQLLIIQPNKPFYILEASKDAEGYVLTLKGNGVLGSMGNHSLIFNLEFLT